MSRSLLIVGAGGHGKVVCDCALASGWQVAGFLDDTKSPGALAAGRSVLGGIRLLNDASVLARHAVIVAFGNQQARRDLSLAIVASGGLLSTVIHPSAIISPSARIGAGTTLIAGCILNADAMVGRFCILNTSCTVDHDCVLEDGVQIGPGASLAGRVHCEPDALIGAGAVIIPDIRVGAGATIGAGAVVVRDVESGTVVVGNPAHNRRLS